MYKMEEKLLVLSANFQTQAVRPRNLPHGLTIHDPPRGTQHTAGDVALHCSRNNLLSVVCGRRCSCRFGYGPWGLVCDLRRSSILG